MYLIYSVSDNVTHGHHIFHDFQQVALEQFVQPRFGMAKFRQGLNGLKYINGYCCYSTKWIKSQADSLGASFVTCFATAIFSSPMQWITDRRRSWLLRISVKA